MLKLFEPPFAKFVENIKIKIQDASQFYCQYYLFFHHRIDNHMLIIASTEMDPINTQDIKSQDILLKMRDMIG